MASYREYRSDSDSEDRRRALRRLGKVDFGDGDGRFARLRRQLRNPSLLTFIVLSLLAISIPLAIMFPGFYSGAQEGIVRIRRDVSIDFLEVSIPSRINPYLQRHIDTMQEADRPIEWRPVSFRHGPCLADNLSQLPVGKYSDGVADACATLDDIQTEYASSCVASDTCHIPSEAVSRLQAVSDGLNAVFSDAYSGYSEKEEDFTP